MRTFEQTSELFLDKFHLLRPLRLARFSSTAGRDRDRDRGLITLEWLLIVGAVASLAASSTLVVQRVVDNSVEVPDDVHVWLIDADIAAAQIAAEATAWRQGLAGDDLVAYLTDGVSDEYDTFYQRCSDLGVAFKVVVESAEFYELQERHDAAWLLGLTEEERDKRAREIAVPALCTVQPREGLGG